MPVKRTIIAGVAFALVLLSAYVLASSIGQIGFNFQIKSHGAPMYNLWFHRYQSPASSSDCHWIGDRGLIAYAGTQQDVNCFHQANPNIIAVTYLDRGVYTSDPLYQALSGDESAWLHWQNGARAYFSWNNNPIYLPNPASTSVRTWEAANWISNWKTLGVNGIFLDDGYNPCPVNGVYKICIGSQPLAEFNSGDYQGWVQAWSDWANWARSQMGRPFHVYPNSVPWYTNYNSGVLSAWLSGMAGVFLEFVPSPYTYGDGLASLYQMQSQYYTVNSSAIIDLFPYATTTGIPSLYWLAAYYLLAKNFTTNNLYLSPPFSFPVPQGFCCEGWNTAVWDNLNIGKPQSAASIVDAFGDGTASLYIRVFQGGIVVAMQDRNAADTRTITVNLPGAYQNVTGGPTVNSITIGAKNAFIGVIPGYQPTDPQAVPVISPTLLLMSGIMISLFIRSMKTTSKPTI